MGFHLKVVSLWVASLTAGQALAEPVIEEVGRLRINWGELSYRYFGEAPWQGNQGEDEASRIAWSEAYAYAKKEGLTASRVRLAHSSNYLSDADPTRGSRSVNTIYYGDGKVRVFLENALPQLYQIVVAQTTPLVSPTATTRHSSVVIHIDGDFEPRPAYEIRDELGSLVLGPEMLSKDVLDHSLMGRWFRQSKGELFQKYAGATPKVVKATAAGSHLRMVRSEWQELLETSGPLLTSAKILLVTGAP